MTSSNESPGSLRLLSSLQVPSVTRMWRSAFRGISEGYGRHIFKLWGNVRQMHSVYRVNVVNDGNFIIHGARGGE